MRADPATLRPRRRPRAVLRSCACLVVTKHVHAWPRRFPVRSSSCKFRLSSCACPHRCIAHARWSNKVDGLTSRSCKRSPQGRGHGTDPCCGARFWMLPAKTDVAWRGARADNTGTGAQNACSIGLSCPLQVARRSRRPRASNGLKKSSHAQLHALDDKTEAEGGGGAERSGHRRAARM